MSSAKQMFLKYELDASKHEVKYLETYETDREILKFQKILHILK